MTKKITFIRRTKWIYFYGLWIAIMVTFSGLSTEWFTRLPSFSGGGKAVIADLLIVPSTIFIIVAFFVVLHKLPKQVELHIEREIIYFNGKALDNPVTVTIEESKEADKYYYSLHIVCQGEVKLKSGYGYKTHDIELLRDLISKSNKITFGCTTDRA